jgi:hypothetical protein
MQRRKTQWFVWPEAQHDGRLRYWWQDGQWTRNPTEAYFSATKADA